MFIRKPAAAASAIWFCRMRLKSWLYGSEWKYRLAGATAYLRSQGRTVIASRSGMATHSSSCGPSSPMPSSAPTVYSSDPAAASARWSIGTHFDFGTPWTSVYAAALDAAGVAEHGHRLVLVEQQSDCRDEQHGQFQDDADAVQDRDHAHAGGDDDRGQHSRDDGDHHRGGGRDLEAREQAVQGHAHHGADGGHDEHDREHVEQAGHPAEEVAAQPAPPPVDAARQRGGRAEVGPAHHQQQ